MAVQKGAVSKNDMKFGNISAVMALIRTENGVLHACHPVGYLHEESPIQGWGITVDLDRDI
jgi:hypothetical protein